MKQYRNITDLTLMCEGRTVLFVGSNAQGKTNILEAIYVLALGKSHRTRMHKELLQFTKTWTSLKAKVKKHDQTSVLHVYMNEKGKKMSINGIEQSRISQYIGSFPVVMFSPEDLSLVKGSPKVRRRLMDTEIGQVSPSYVHHLSTYNRMVLQRNHLLKSFAQKKKENLDLLEVLNEQLLDLSGQIWKKRYYFMAVLVKWAKQIHQEITMGKDEIEIHYEPSVAITGEMDLKEMKEIAMQELKKIRHKEMMRGTTLLGPHRDDLVLSVNNQSLHAFGSQGQQRTAALSLKLAGLEFIKQELGTYPILLLDDVLSELDDLRKTQLLDTIYHRVQTFVTSTSLEGIDQQILDKADIYRVSDGNIERI